MKKLISKIKNKINNSGSSLVLVIVALAFVGILTGALLTAVAYVYRLKLYDYNAKSNFYYLEQAMDEVYAGLGSQTMIDMQEAYQETREKVVHYDPDKNTYKNIGNEKANMLFKDSFMNKIQNNDFYQIKLKADGTVDDSDGLVAAIKGMISNNTVVLNPDKMFMKVEYIDNSDPTKGLKKIVIKNVRLDREVEYNRSQANGTFKQSISTDIEIARPDFEVNFDSANADVDNLFKFCMVADSGVEVNEQPGDVLTINGNIYAASDFYNKAYNKYDPTSTATIKQDEFDPDKILGTGEETEEEADSEEEEGSDTKISNKILYKMNKVSKYAYGDDSLTTLRNDNLFNKGSKEYLYDGYNDNSRYSGFYIDGSTVNILADYVIVPGSLSVMNSGDLTVYGLNDASELSEANVWADEVVLAGRTATSSTNKKIGASALFNANLFVKDDTQIESESSELKFIGGYYGYSDSNTSDKRIFVPTTKKDKNNIYNIYEQVGADNKIENRGHYNSSAIVVNGQDATVDLSSLNVMYIAGRSYIELSRQKTGTTKNRGEYTFEDVKKNQFTTNDTKNTYEYNAASPDYKTGESVSIKSNQLAYIPDGSMKKYQYKLSSASDYDLEYKGKYYSEAPMLQEGQCDLILGFCDVPDKLASSYLFQKYFNKGETTTKYTIPVIYRSEQVSKNGSNEKKTKTMYYINFDYVVDKELYDTTATSVISFPTGVNKADYLSSLFVKDYFDYLNYEDIYQDRDRYMGTATWTYIMNNVDTNILDDPGLDEILKDVTNYDDFDGGQLAIFKQDDTTVNKKSYSSGVLTNSGNAILKTTSSDNIDFNVVTSKGSTIESTLEGLTTGSTGYKTGTVDEIKEFNLKYQDHYNYVKWSLMDLDAASPDAKICDEIISKNGESAITPINKYMNFDYITDNDPLMKSAPTDPDSETDINPDNLDLGDYKVWISNDDVEIEAGVDDDNTVTGIIISKGDVYFKNKTDYSSSESYKAVDKFNGIIITGGKVYVNNDVTNISASKLCKNIINACITKAGNANNSAEPDKMAEARKAIRVLSLFKSYQKLANEALSGDYNKGDSKSITNIDYSDVLRYNNWMRNVD